MREKTQKKDTIFKYKILYTASIMLIYMLGRNLPLYGIDMAQYNTKALDAENLIMQTVGGDMRKASLFALGISPYITASLVSQLVFVIRKNITKTQVSPRKKNRLILGGTLFLATWQAVSRVSELSFAVRGDILFMAKAVAVVELITGALLILWLCERNKKYGIGGQTVIIFVNILTGFVLNLSAHAAASLAIPLAVSAVAIIAAIILENAERRVPVLRISIHNVYADKNYIAVKMNPIGIMPIMFSTAFFTLPRLVVQGLAYLFPQSAGVAWWQENLVMTRPLGIAVYIGILYLLTIVFSLVSISPGDITEQFLKSGDCIPNIHTGKATKRYLTKVIAGAGFFSATVMGVCVGVPLVLQLHGNVDSALAMLPATAIMLAGLWCNLYQEVMAIRSYDSYEPFL